MRSAKLNYYIYDKDLLAVICVLQCWQAKLIGLQLEEPFLIVSNYKALKYFSTKRLLNIH